MVTRKRSTPKVYALHVALDEIVPPVWRRIIVPAAITLPELHDLLQLVMGWTNSHLHSFTIGNRTYSNAAMADGELDEMEMLDEAKHTLVELLGAAVKTFVYDYDFGDSWRHRIDVETIAAPNPDWEYPLCVAGERAAPPEDVGGVPGYEDFLAAISDPEDEEHDSYLTWVGGAFDPEGFDLNAINRVLRFADR